MRALMTIVAISIIYKAYLLDSLFHYKRMSEDKKKALIYSTVLLSLASDVAIVFTMFYFNK
jgi:hypothetical protein